MTRSHEERVDLVEILKNGLNCEGSRMAFVSEQTVVDLQLAREDRVALQRALEE